jgi:hypothetical protein
MAANGTRVDAGARGGRRWLSRWDASTRRDFIGPVTDICVRESGNWGMSGEPITTEQAKAFSAAQGRLGRGPVSGSSRRTS